MLLSKRVFGRYVCLFIFIAFIEIEVLTLRTLKMVYHLRQDAEPLLKLRGLLM